MNYKDVIIAERLEDYIASHKKLYRTLSSMIFDISFLEACVELQDHDLDYDLITIKFLHRDVFENLITKLYRGFFDNSGQHTTNLFKFKNQVLREFIKPEYYDTIFKSICELPIESAEYKPYKQLLERNILGLRAGYIAHGLDNPSDSATVHLKDVRKLVEYGCELFQKLSFEPKGFYSFFEGDGYDFSKEFSYTGTSTRSFMKYAILSSKHISNITCQVRSDCDTATKEKIDKLVSDINIEKSASM